MKSRAVRSGTETAKSIKLPTKVQNAATANNTRRNQTPDAAETAVLAAVGVKLEEFSDTLASCDSSTGHIVTGQTGTLKWSKRRSVTSALGSKAESSHQAFPVRFSSNSRRLARSALCQSLT